MTKSIDIPDEIIRELRKLIGIDLIVAMRLFREHGNIITRMRGYNKEVGGFPEELIALTVDEQRPTSSKGRDFDMFEVKSVKGEKRVRGGYSTKGDTPVSSFTNVSFFDSNIWAKLRKMLVIIHYNNIIVDIRFFNGEDMVTILQDDYNLISIGKRTDTKILALKEKTNSIQIRFQGAIRKSLSIVNEDYTNNIINQEEYIMELFAEKLAKHKQENEHRKATTLEKFLQYVNSPLTTISEIEKLRKILDDKLNNILGYDDKTESEF